MKQIATQSPITLERRGQAVHVHGAEGLALPERFFVLDHSLPYVREPVLRRMQQLRLWPRTFQGQPVLEGFAGLEDELEAYLRERGHDVIRSGVRPGALPTPAPRLENFRLRGIDRELLRFVADHERGLLLREPAGTRVAWLIGQLVLAWPRLRFAVTVTHRDRVGPLARELAHVCPGVTPLPGGWRPETIERVAVGTHVGIAAVNLAGIDVHVTLDPVHACTASRSQLQSLTRMPRARLYGVLDVDRFRNLPAYERDLVTAVFGRSRVTVAPHERPEVAVDVLWRPFRRGPRCSERNPTSLRRDGLWRNQARHRHVARIAREFAESTSVALRERYPGPGELAPRDVRRVGVLVEGVEQATSLARHLPGWPIVASPDVWEEGLPAAVRRALRQGRNPNRRTRDHVLVTRSGLQRCGTLDVLVRADGGREAPAVPRSGSPNCRVLIIDYVDRHHPRLRRDAEDRAREYVGRGWASHGGRPGDRGSRRDRTGGSHR